MHLARTALAALLATIALGASSAAAAAPPPPPPPPPGQPPSQPPALSLHLASGLRDGGRTYVIAGQPVVVQGTIQPYTPGQSVVVQLKRGGRTVGGARASAHLVGGVGHFQVTLRSHRGGGYTVVATLPQGQQQASSKPVGFTALRGRAGPGSGGIAVRLLQRALNKLGYVNSASGRYDSSTQLAVLAYRKVNFMSRTTTANEVIFARLFRLQGGFRLRYRGAGRHVEFDFSRQVLVLADHGRAERIYHASSGKASTPTVFGTFSFYSKVPGTNSEGMYDSNYFIRGYAVHGYPSVPTYPASHGCIRVPLSVAASIFSWIQIGERIFVY